MISRIASWVRSNRSARLGVAFVTLALVAAMAFPAFPTTSASYCRVRVLIASPDVTTVDVLLNSIQIASGNKLGDLTPYATRPADHYGLRAFPPGVTEPGKAYVGHNVYLMGGKDYTVIVFGKSADKTLDIIAETDNNTLDSASARVRFANDLPGSGTLTLTASGSSTSVGAAYGQTSDSYTPITPGAITLTATNASGTAVAQTTATLSASTALTAFAIPGTGGTGATLLLSLDAGTPAMPLNAASGTTGGTGTSPATAATPATTGAAVSATTGTDPTTVALNATGTALSGTAAAVLSGKASTPTAAPTGGASAALRTALAPVPMVADTDSKVFFAATGHTLGGVFKVYWDSHGGLEQFGYPVTEEYQEVSATDGKTYTTQYFERARFEDHTDKAGTPNEVQQGLLGRELIKLLGAG